MPNPRVIYWFRTDLRLHDSPALQAALDLQPAVLWPIFTFDPHYIARHDQGSTNRWQFLLDCQNDLSKSITKINPKSRLFVLREAPQTLLPKLFAAWRVTHVVFEKDTDSYALDRDKVITKAAKDAGVDVVVRTGRTLWDPDELVKANGGDPTMTITQLRKAGCTVGAIPRPIKSPETLPDPGEMPLEFDHTSDIAGPNGDFAVETMDELKLPPATTPHRGGETVALNMLDKIISNREYTATFRKPNTSPTAFEPQSTTLLSPFLHFGALSPRLFYHRVQDVVSSYKGASSPPESLTGQLLFREMYFAAQAAIGPVFAQTRGNSHCRFIPWHLPSIHDPKTGLAIRGQYEIDSEAAKIWFLRWKAGKTGFPWIDALMRQLRETGWIHHLGRHAVACFLTRGGCYISWERGAEVFEEFLLDHEPACNAGNWQWLSCTAFFHQYFRCYSPVSYAGKWDKNGEFVRKWVPELKNVNAKYIYEPWKMSILDQKKAGVRIAGDGFESSKIDGLPVYPKPMLDWNDQKKKCLAGMKKAYQIGLLGNNNKVYDGSWREFFEEDSSGKKTKRRLSTGGSTKGEKKRREK